MQSLVALLLLDMHMSLLCYVGSRFFFSLSSGVETDSKCVFLYSLHPSSSLPFLALCLPVNFLHHLFYFLLFVLFVAIETIRKQVLKKVRVFSKCISSKALEQKSHCSICESKSVWPLFGTQTSILLVKLSDRTWFKNKYAKIRSEELDPPFMWMDLQTAILLTNLT